MERGIVPELPLAAGVESKGTSVVVESGWDTRGGDGEAQTVSCLSTLSLVHTF
jgi:hypothetical protein